MTSFSEFADQFEARFNVRHFPEHTPTLYDPAQYILSIKGKRVRPVLVYMANELFAAPNDDAYHAAASVELFHNFSLIHDDIMDRAPLRRGLPTVHEKYGESTALLAGDVMFAMAYDYLSRISAAYLPKSIEIFNRTAKQVCEGQQLDMDLEKVKRATGEEYLNMITLKTSVLLAAALEMGAVLGGAGPGNQEHLYLFGKHLGIAFQVQDDYLDVFGNDGATGKQRGGDILADKKTFLLIHAYNHATPEQTAQLDALAGDRSQAKLDAVIAIFKSTGADRNADELKQKHYALAMEHLEKVAVQDVRKSSLRELAESLMTREK